MSRGLSLPLPEAESAANDEGLIEAWLDGSAPLSRSEIQRFEYLHYRADLARLMDAWEEIHVWFLRRNAEIVNSPHTSLNEVREMMEWINAPSADGKPLRPFSFEACVFCWDPSADSETFRQLFLADRRRRCTWARG